VAFAVPRELLGVGYRWSLTTTLPQRFMIQNTLPLGSVTLIPMRLPPIAPAASAKAPSRHDAGVNTNRWCRCHFHLGLAEGSEQSLVVIVASSV